MPIVERTLVIRIRHAVRWAKGPIDRPEWPCLWYRNDIGHETDEDQSVVFRRGKEEAGRR